MYKHTGGTSMRPTSIAINDTTSYCQDSTSNQALLCCCSLQRYFILRTRATMKKTVTRARIVSQVSPCDGVLGRPTPTPCAACAGDGVPCCARCPALPRTCSAAYLIFDFTAKEPRTKSPVYQQRKAFHENVITHFS